VLTWSAWISKRRSYKNIEQMQAQLQTTQLSIQCLKGDKEDLLRAMSDKLHRAHGLYNSNIPQIINQSLGALHHPTSTTIKADRTFY